MPSASANAPFGCGSATLGRRAITADTALRLARYFGTSAEYWLNLQSAYDLQVAERKIAGRIKREVLPLDGA